MKELLFLYNPTSGKGKVKGELSAILDTFTKAGYLVTVRPTQEKGDAARIAKELGGQFDRVICSGGDGTLSETAAGLMQLEHPPVLGYVPFGSTNDCAATLRLPKKVQEAAALAVGDRPPRPWDVGMLNDRAFIYVAAFGAFTEVSYDTPQDLKNTFGHLAYVMAGIASIPSISPYRMRVEVDDQQVLEDDFYYGMVCNTISVGGMKALPADKVVVDDGKFEVVLVRKPSSIADVTASLQALIRQAPLEDGALLSFHASRLTFTCDRPVPWTVDGEYGGSQEGNRVENCRQALQIMQGE